MAGTDSIWSSGNTFLYSGCGGECERGGGSCLLIVFNGNVSVRPFIAPYLNGFKMRSKIYFVNGL